MNQHVVDAPDKIARIFSFILLCFFRAQPVEKAYLTENKRLFCLQQGFANPAKNYVGLQKPLWTSCDHRSDARHGVITNLLILTQRANATFLIAIGALLKRATCTDDGVRFAFDFRPRKSN